MPKKKTVESTIVYVVQDYEQQLCGVFTTLAAAAKRYEEVLTHGLTETEKQELIDEFGQDFHEELDYVPCIVVYRVDDIWLWSYDSLLEVKHALEDGEQYDD